MTDSKCGACFRIIETKALSVSIPNVFGFELEFDIDMCKSCGSLLDWFVYQYIELYEEQSKKLKDKQFSLTNKTLRSLR